MSSISDEIYSKLREEILSGSLPTEEPLREQNLAQRYGASRTPIRSALRRLEGEGLVLLLQNRGAPLLSWNKFEISDTYDLLSDIESRIAAQAAANASGDEVQTLKDVLEQSSRLLRSCEQNFDQILHLNKMFHHRISEVANRPTLTDYHNSIVQRFPLKAAFQRSGFERLIKVHNQHSELIEAIEAKDPEWAASLMKSHTLGVKRYIIATMVN
ncbi:MAG: GntR family transcriptional regulator [Actinomycetota bacterium]|nr:GntR family transcriptional regulator [Actinomycetota bacterium]